MPRYKVLLQDDSAVYVTADDVSLPNEGYYVFKKLQGDREATAAIFLESDVKWITSDDDAANDDVPF